MSASSDLKHGEAVIVLDVDRNKNVVVHSGHIGSQVGPARALVQTDDFEKEIQLSDPRLLTEAEARDLSDPVRAREWYGAFYPSRIVETIAETLRQVNNRPQPLGT
jgi:hypothetical protein